MENSEGGSGGQIPNKLVDRVHRVRAWVHSSLRFEFDILDTRQVILSIFINLWKYDQG